MNVGGKNWKRLCFFLAEMIPAVFAFNGTGHIDDTHEQMTTTRCVAMKKTGSIKQYNAKAYS